MTQLSLQRNKTGLERYCNVFIIYKYITQNSKTVRINHAIVNAVQWFNWLIQNNVLNFHFVNYYYFFISPPVCVQFKIYTAV